MSKGLKKAGKIIGGIEDWMVIVLFTAMVVVTMAIVLCRYVFKVQFVPGEEIARYLMIWCGYAGAAMGFRTHAHVGVVVFAEKFPKSMALAIVHTIVDIQEDFAPAKTETAESEGAEL